MTDQKPPSTLSTLSGNITAGDISGSTGVAIGHGAQATVTQTDSMTNDEIAQAFALLTQKVNTLPDGPDKAVAQSAIQALETEAHKGEQVDESSLHKWLNFLAETAPDVWEVVIDTFLHPIKGLSTIFKKVAERAKAEREAKK